MKQYQCVECQTIYSEETVPETMVCNSPNCPGGGLTGLCIEIPPPPPPPGPPGPGGKEEVVSPPRILTEKGLCILLMDASGSMGDPAYREHSFPSKYGGHLTKREVITDVAAKAIFELQPMVKKDDAYICAIKFDHTQAVMFTKTVSEILDEYSTPQNLAKYLYNELAAMNGGTDINAALKMAYSFTQKFEEGSVPGMGNYVPLTQTQFAPSLNESIDVPNVRTLIYTDGENYDTIQNPFKNNVPDLLMGAYIGKSGEAGCEDLKKAISDCPIHGVKQFFVLDSPEKIATIRGLFRMASGTSGFCPHCIAGNSLR